VAVPHERPAGPATAERPAKEEPEVRDRKGRRSRRRRSRGRGLPETKYADLGARAPSPVPVAPAAPETPEEEFPLLPGESLAKYRRRPASFSWPAPLEPEEETTEAVAEEPEEEQRAETAPVAGEQAASEEDSSVGFEEGEAEGAGLEDPAAEPESEPVAGETVETGLGAGETTAEGGDGEEDEELERVAAEQSPETAEAAEDLLMPPPGAEPAEGAEMLETLERGEAEAEPEEPEAGSEERTEPAAQRPLTAEVRQLEPRYLHRPARRERRRGRQSAAPQRIEREEAAAAPAKTEAAAPREKPPLPSITDLLKEGQEIIVQVAKEPLGQKGARITSHIALPGRYVVYMPTVDHIGVSRKIASDEERQRLRRILQTHRTGIPGGFIMRTAGEGKSEEEIAADMNFLFNLWLEIRKKAEKKTAPALLHHDLQVVERVLRDQVTSDFKTIWVDSEDAYESIVQFLQRFQPSLMPRVRLYTRPEPIFEVFNITAELEKALRPKVWLKSGGYIVINQTEALVAIDINTGKFVGGKSNRLEDTIVKTNLEAVNEIVRQIRLRDLGGIIVVDFIDMEERKNRQKVMQALEEAMRADRAPYKILQFNDFGLVAITRKRVKQSLERTLCSPCPYCEGAGYVKSVTTIIGEILVEAQKLARTIERDSVMLRVHPDVAREIKSSKENYLEELEEILGRPVVVTGDPLLHHEKFDLA
jgi:ribonuclease G